MSDREKLKEMVDTFSFEVIEEYKTITIMIKRDSGFLSILKKKHYDEIIQKLKEIRRISKGLSPRSVETNGPIEKDVVDYFAKALNIFNKLCDEQIELQTLFQKKAKKESNVKMSDCSSVMHEINEDTGNLQKALRTLDIRWADFLEENE